MQIQSYFEIDRTYFFTATIHQWLPLLDSEENKQLIVNYLKEPPCLGSWHTKQILLIFHLNCKLHYANSKEILF
jgi:AAA+ superfamily predicted ATPase